MTPFEQQLMKPENLTAGIQKAFTEEIQKVIDEEAKLAAERCAKRVRTLGATLAVQLFEHVDFSRLTRDLIVQIRIPPAK